MKTLQTIMVAFLVVFSSTNLLAQTQIQGKWKIVKVDVSDKIRLNVEKDSMQLTQEFWEEADQAETMDSTGKAAMTGAIKSGLMMAFTKMGFLIDDKNDIYETSENKKIGQYDAAKKTLTFSDTDPGSKKVIPLEMKDGLLKFTLPGNKEEEISIWCRKAD